MFIASSTASNATVKKAAEEYRKNQVKSQLHKLWSDKTGGSKNPRIWSEKYRTPILCCIKATQYADAKRAFAILNSSTQSEADIKEALAFFRRQTSLMILLPLFIVISALQRVLLGITQA